MKKTARKTSRFGFGWMPDLPDNRDHLYSALLAKLRERFEGIQQRRSDLRVDMNVAH